MLPFLYVFFSGIAGALYGLSYKLRSQHSYPIYRMLFLFSVFTTLFSLAPLALFNQPLFSAKSLVLGLPYGLFMVISLSLYFVVSGRAKLNISWTIVQFSVVIPFVLSIFWYGERLESIAVFGIALIFVSLIFFGAGKRDPSGGRAIPDPRTAVMLFLSFLFTGASSSIPKIFAVVEPEAGPFTLFLYRGLSMIPLSLILMRLREGTLKKHRWKPGLFFLAAYMSLNSVLLGVLTILALRGGIGGSVAFPLRAIVNVLLVFLLSFLLFREKVTFLEGVGALVALAGIAMVSAALGS